MFFSILSRRFKRVMLCLRRALPKALALTSVLMFILLVFSCFFFKDGAVYSGMLGAMLLIFSAMWGICFVEQLTKYGMKIFHRYDEEIIGSAFADLSKKSAVFESGLEFFHAGHFKSALDVFTQLDDESIPKTREEQGVLSFYRGRCYHILQIYPNALVNYDKAIANGFDLDVLPMFVASCASRNGDASRAVKIYSEIMDSDHAYADAARTEMGHHYLRENDGENAYKWFKEAVDRHENYAEALGGLAVALTLMNKIKEGEEYYRAALLNHVEDAEGFTDYFKQVQAAVMLETRGNSPSPDKGGAEEDV